MRRAFGGSVLVLVCFAGCAAEESTPACAGLTLEHPVLVLETDLARQVSAMGRVDENGCLEEIDDVALRADPVLTEGHGRPLVLARDSGEVKTSPIARPRSALAALCDWLMPSALRPTSRWPSNLPSRCQSVTPWRTR